MVEAAGIRNTCRSTNHKVELPSQHVAPDLSLIMRVASVGLPHCVQTLHVLKWDTEELMDTRVLMSHLFSPNNLNFFSVTPFPVSTPNMQLGVKLVEDSSADGVPHVIIANKVIFYCMNPRCMAILPSTAHPWKRIWGPGAGFDYSEVMQYS